jgi:hypothetical protein
MVISVERQTMVHTGFRHMWLSLSINNFLPHSHRILVYLDKGVAGAGRPPSLLAQARCQKKVGRPS